MKIFFKFFTTVITLVLPIILLLACCNNQEPEPQTEKERVVTLLKANTWKIQTVTVDNTDQTALFNNMTISFTDASYITSKGGVVWPATGSFTFNDDTAKSFTREDAIVVTIENVTENTLTLSLNWTKTTFSGGRVSSIAGKTSFAFGK